MSVQRVPWPDGDVQVVAVTGELDIANAAETLAQIQALSGSAPQLVLDLSRLDFFDSAGIRLLDRLAADCSRAGGCLQVVAPPGTSTRRVLELVGMAASLARDDLPAAVEAVVAGG